MSWHRARNDLTRQLIGINEYLTEQNGTLNGSGLETMNVGCDDLSFGLQAEGLKPLLHFVQPWQIVHRCHEPITQETLHVTLAMQLGIPAAIAMR